MADHVLPKIVVTVKDGMVTYIAANRIIDYVVVDYDDPVRDIPGTADVDAELAKGQLESGEATLDPEWVNEIHSMSQGKPS